ncbi:MAG: sulfotransferase [Alphaproteobacteria bacterium]|nr:sulfotransferase [Alphaproteobacteria bacterium]
MLPAPLFILCPGRSFSSVVCSMLGEHPELYGLPEVNLFIADTVGQFLDQVDHPGQRNMRHGILRVLAELDHGEQTDATVDAAFAWLEERRAMSTRDLYYHVCERAAPRRVVDKSPPHGRPENLRRLFQAFPHARFLHLGRHPRTSGISTFKAKQNKKLAAGANPGEVQRRWDALHQGILDFAAQLPPGQVMYLQGEMLLENPDPFLRQIATWLGVSAGAQAIEAMKHPEASPYARPGPDQARGGNNRGFLENPALRVGPIKPSSLNGPLEWMPDGSGFGQTTHLLARRLGYR